MKKILSLLLISCLLVNNLFAAEWLSTWAKRISFTVDAAKIDSTLTWFPLLFHISASSGTGSTDISDVFDDLGANSLKIAVTTSDGITEIKGEIDEWDNSGEQAYVWVSADGATIDATEDEIFYLYFDPLKGDNTTNIGDDADDTPTNAVWDGDFVGVYHLKESGATAKDSTSGSNDGTFGGILPNPSAAVVGDGQSHQPAGGLNSLANETNFDFTTAMTIAVILNSSGNDSGGDKRIVSKNASAWRLRTVADEKMHFEHTTGALIDGTAMVTGTSYYYAADFTSAAQTLYKNAGSVATATVAGSVGTNNDKVFLGYEASGVGGDDYWRGLLDEIRFSDASRGAAWAKAEYYTAFDDIGEWGEVEIMPSGSAGNTIGSVSVDGTVTPPSVLFVDGTPTLGSTVVNVY